jgi:hypothetical protein
MIFGSNVDLGHHYFYGCHFKGESHQLVDVALLKLKIGQNVTIVKLDGSLHLFVYDSLFEGMYESSVAI